MSAEIYVVRTRFQTLDENGQVERTSYGARVYDDYGCTYVNSLDTLEELTALSAGELLEFVRHESEQGSVMLEAAAEYSRLFVDDEMLDDLDADEEI